MSRPDGGQDDLGSRVLDEPSAKQSDPTVLDLHLRAITKEANVKPVVSDFVQGTSVVVCSKYLSMLACFKFY